MPWRIPRICGRSLCVPQIIIDTSMLVPRLDARELSVSLPWPYGLHLSKIIGKF